MGDIGSCDSYETLVKIFLNRKKYHPTFKINTFLLNRFLVSTHQQKWKFNQKVPIKLKSVWMWWPLPLAVPNPELCGILKRSIYVCRREECLEWTQYLILHFSKVQLKRLSFVYGFDFLLLFKQIRTRILSCSSVMEILIVRVLIFLRIHSCQKCVLFVLLLGLFALHYQC